MRFEWRTNDKASSIRKVVTVDKCNEYRPNLYLSGVSNSSGNGVLCSGLTYYVNLKCNQVILSDAIAMEIGYKDMR